MNDIEKSIKILTTDRESGHKEFYSFEEHFNVAKYGSSSRAKRAIIEGILDSRSPYIAGDNGYVTRKGIHYIFPIYELRGAIKLGNTVCFYGHEEVILVDIISLAWTADHTR